MDFNTLYEDAIAYLAMRRPLYMQLLFALPNKVSDDCPTAYTNFRERAFNPDFMGKQTIKAQAGLIMHELCHEILQHNIRRGDRDAKLWNRACDMYINHHLAADGASLPDGGVKMREGWESLTEEDIYDRLKQEGGDIEFTLDFDPNSDGITPEQQQALAAHVKAAVDMYGVGSLPSAMQEQVVGLLTPKTKWYDTLRQFFTARMYSGCDWTQVCRRQLDVSGICAPVYQSDSLGTVVISVDQSGSIGTEMLEYFAGHVNAILFECQPKKVIVQYFDTEVHDTDEFETTDLPITLRRVCGGGTSFVDACSKAELYGANVHVVLTDMYGEFPAGSIVPTVWAATTGEVAPFGTTIRVEVGE